MVGGADETVFLHPLDPLGGGVVADAHLALEPGSARLLVLEHDLAGLAVLALLGVVGGGEIVVEAEEAILGLLGDRVDIFRLALRAPVLRHALDFLVADEGAVDALQGPGAGLVEHIALAEQLLGKGDMLYKPSSGPLKRVHGPFVSDEEVERVAQHWRAQGEPEYVDSVTEEPEDGFFGFDDDLTASDNPEERKYRQACQIVFENQKASGSWLQRQMGVGYNTAAKWIERMEEDGLVGPANHVGRREIYRDRDGNPL